MCIIRMRPIRSNYQGGGNERVAQDLDRTCFLFADGFHARLQCTGFHSRSNPHPNADTTDGNPHPTASLFAERQIVI